MASTRFAGQIDRALARVSLAAEKQRGVPNGTDANAATLVGNLSAECGALVAVGPEETELHKLAVIEGVLKLFIECGRETSATDLERSIHLLAKSAEESFLSAGERIIVHILTTDGTDVHGWENNSR